MRCLTFRLTILLVITASCTHGTSPSATASSSPGDETRGGTRLKAVLAVAADVTHFLGWHDTQLDVACAFSVAEGGQLRCLPDAAEAATVADLSFTDAACTQPLGQLYPYTDWFDGCPQPRFARGGSADGSCSSETTIYRVGEQVTFDQVYRRDASGCAPGLVTKRPGAMGSYRLEAVAADQFVAGSLETGPAEEGVVPVHVVTPDGARGMWGFRDATEGFECDLQLTEDGLRCLPTDKSLVGYLFADAACKTPAAIALSCLEGLRSSIAFGVALTPGPNGGVFKMFRGGPRLEVSFVGTPSQCTVDTSASPGFEVGSEIAASRFAAGTKDSEPHGDGLTWIIDRAGGFPIPRQVRSAVFPDQNCHFAPTSDGILRCVSDPELLIPYFSDDQCTQAVSAAQEAMITVPDRSTCPPQMRVFSRGPVQTAAVYTRTGTTCSWAAAAPPNSARLMYYSYATEVAPEQLARFERVER